MDLSISIYKKIFPAPPPPPTVTYGKLPKINFPDKQNLPKLTFSLETAEGGFPKFADQAKVYFMPKPAANLLALDTAKEEAKSLGFDFNNPQSISETTYKFTSPTFPSYLEVNVVTNNFSISYDLNADRTPLDMRPPSPEIAASQARSLLSSAGLLPDDLIGPVKNEFLKLSNGRLKSVLALSEADLVKVNFFRRDYDNLPSVTQNPDEANVWFIVSGASDKNQQVVAGQFHYYPVDETQSSTYPIKTAQDAFTQLQNGQAFIANPGINKDGASVKIRKIYLAYFDPAITNGFYEPIFVLEGDNGFVAYVPAVTDDYYGE